MNELEQKRKRVEPLIRIRQHQLDMESAELVAIRHEKMAALQCLREQQEQYVNGVQEVNRLRQSNDPGPLSEVERGLDMVKNKCYEILKQIRVCEQKERAQLELLYLARRNVKSMETLKDRYGEQIKELATRNEQKLIDEFAVNKFTADNRK